MNNGNVLIQAIIIALLVFCAVQLDAIHRIVRNIGGIKTYSTEAPALERAPEPGTGVELVYRDPYSQGGYYD